MLEDVCDPVGEGQIVVTELRGPQSGVDSWGQWIELYNDAGRTLSVGGLEVWLTDLDGTRTERIMVRDPDLSLASGEYLVLGRFDDAALPDHVDYGYVDDFDTDLFPDGKVEVYVCGELVDTVTFHDLPDTGSLTFDGDEAPDAVLNDVESNWCIDASEISHPTEIGIPGTPGEQNRSCN